MMIRRIVIKSASGVKGSDVSIQVTGKQLKQNVKCETFLYQAHEDA